MSTSVFDLSGKKALVTGASRGLGRAMAVALARSGADVALCARDLQALEVTRASVEAHGVKGPVFIMDVRSRDSVAAGVAAAAASLGTIDILVNNAGVNVRKPVLELSEDEWDLVIDTNLKGYFLVAQQVGALASSKGGAVEMTKVMALEWARYGITVNAIAPTYFETPL